MNNNFVFIDQFGYSNTEQRHWYHKHADCAGRNQSPISISSYKVKQNDFLFP